jgi:hypothetical protein
MLNISYTLSDDADISIDVFRKRFLRSDLYMGGCVLKVGDLVDKGSVNFPEHKIKHCIHFVTDTSRELRKGATVVGTVRLTLNAPNYQTSTPNRGYTGTKLSGVHSPHMHSEHRYPVVVGGDYTAPTTQAEEGHHGHHSGMSGAGWGGGASGDPGVSAGDGGYGGGWGGGDSGGGGGDSGGGGGGDGGGGGGGGGGGD